MPIKYGWKPRTAFTELDDTPEKYDEGAVKVKDDLTGVEFSLIAGADAIASSPPLGMHRITNLFWDPDLQKVVADFDDNPKG